MTGSQKLYLRIRSLTLGRTTAEYPLEGSATAVQAAFAGCPVMLAQTKKHTS
jgi:H2-forming N5,N10-methylenetetrahydromethanopterin dehydrogenase-like enzyme